MTKYVVTYTRSSAKKMWRGAARTLKYFENNFSLILRTLQNCEKFENLKVLSNISFCHLLTIHNPGIILEAPIKYCSLKLSVLKFFW